MKSSSATVESTIMATVGATAVNAGADGSNACARVVTGAPRGKVEFERRLGSKANEETRSSRHRYLFEMDRVDHIALLEILQRVPAAVMVSGYHSKLYADMLASWRVVTFEAITRGGTTRTEHLWCNFSQPVELHDYRYLGRNFRERQDIRRLKARWVNKLINMPLLKQRALFAALQEVHDRQPRHK